MATQPIEGTNDRRRLVVLLAILGIAIALGLLYLLLASGSDTAPESASPPVDTAEVVQQAPEDVSVSVEEGDQILVSSTSQRDPFEPLVGDTAPPPSSTSSTKDTNKSSNPASKAPSSTTRKTPVPDVVRDTTPKSTSPQVQADSEAVDPQPVAPEPIDSGKDANDAPLVRLIDVQSEEAVVRIDGERITLYIGIAGDQDVVYFAPLGGGCAWMGRADSQVRVSVCKGKAERL